MPSFTAFSFAVLPAVPGVVLARPSSMPWFDAVLRHDASTLNFDAALRIKRFDYGTWPANGNAGNRR
jgi:hypothetical protein